MFWWLVLPECMNTPRHFLGFGFRDWIWSVFGRTLFGSDREADGTDHLSGSGLLQEIRVQSREQTHHISSCCSRLAFCEQFIFAPSCWVKHFYRTPTTLPGGRWLSIAAPQRRTGRSASRVKKRLRMRRFRAPLDLKGNRQRPGPKETS